VKLKSLVSSGDSAGIVKHDMVLIAAAE